MSEDSDKSTDSARPGPIVPDPDGAARLARRKKWDRITLGIILVMVAVFVTAVVYRREIRAHYWAWRLRQADDPDQRTLWGRSLVTAGEAAYGPAIGLTRSDDPAVRHAGMQVLIDALWAVRSDRTRKAGADAPVPTPRVAARFRELLNDADRHMKFQAMDGLALLGDRAALPKLIELAGGSADTETTLKALPTLAALDPASRADPQAGRLAAETLRRVLADARDPNVRVQSIDCLRDYPSDATLGSLVGALADLRAVTIPPQSEQIPPEMRAWAEKELQKRLLAAGRLGPPTTQPQAAVATQPDRPSTVADYADRVLRYLTGQEFGFDSTAPQSDRDAVIQRWRDYIARKRA